MVPEKAAPISLTAGLGGRADHKGCCKANLPQKTSRISLTTFIEPQMAPDYPYTIFWIRFCSTKITLLEHCSTQMVPKKTGPISLTAGLGGRADHEGCCKTNLPQKTSRIPLTAFIEPKIAPDLPN